MSAELIARLGGPVAAGGLFVLVLASARAARLAGLGLWAAGMTLFLPLLAPAGGEARLAAVAAAGGAGSGFLAFAFHRVPWSLAFLALAAVPARVPIDVGGTSANLLLPLYAVVAGAALALGWSLWRDDPQAAAHRDGPACPAARELGRLAWPLSLLVLWLGLSALWTSDVREASIELFFFVFPFGLLALALARLPWNARAAVGLYGLLAAMALLFAAVGIWQWLTRDVFWNPKVVVGNAYAPFYRVNSLFWDPSIYGRFLVCAILASLAVLLFRVKPVRPRWEVAVGVVIAAAWVGLLFSFSQSSFAALVFGVLLAAALAWRWRALGAVALVSVVMVPLGISSPQLENVRSNVVASSTSALNRATSGRFDLVLNGLEIAADHPLAGVGVGSFKKAYAERQGLRRAPPRAASHTTAVSVAAETGVVGLALLVWLIAGGVLVALRGSRDGTALAATTAIGSGLVFAAIVVHSQFYDAFFEDPMMWGLLGLAALAAAAGRSPPAQPTALVRRPRSVLLRGRRAVG